jgi:hypothetical protein
MFVRLQWLETIGRYERIFRDTRRPSIAFFAERVPLCKGELEARMATPPRPTSGWCGIKGTEPRRRSGYRPASARR